MQVLIELRFCLSENEQERMYFHLHHWMKIHLRIVGRESRLTLANLGNDRRSISKEYISIDTIQFWETKSKPTRAYAQSGQYHTTVESRIGGFVSPKVRKNLHFQPSS